jgi:hypothetical protein
VTEAMAELVGAVRHGLALVLVHHQRKGGGEELEGARGSGAIVGMPDAVIELERLGGDAPPTQRQLVAAARWTPAPPRVLVIDRDPATGAYGVIGEGEDRAGAVEIAKRQALLKALPPEDEPEGSWPGYKELEERLGDVRSTWSGALGKLVGEGKVRRSGGGVKGDPYRFAKVLRIPSGAPTTESTESGLQRDSDSVVPYIDDGIESQLPGFHRGIPSATETETAGVELERLRHKFPEGAT